MQLLEWAHSVGIKIQNEQLLQEALTHRSYLNEIRGEGIHHNERLEFLGDAVLELVITDHLYKQYPDRPEGELTSFRAAVVRTESLATSSEEIKVGEHIRMSRGEANSGGRNRPYILANTFESLVGAVYLDQGYAAAAEFIHQYLVPKLEKIVAERLDIDPKSKLQELTQEVVRVTPIYQLAGEQGPDHDKNFTMEVTVAGVVCGSGTGRSKQDAEQRAAANALENWAELYQKHFSSGKIQR